MSAPILVSPKHCAVYCRVSSDERLDQSFNSIDAQKEVGLVRKTPISAVFANASPAER